MKNETILIIDDEQAIREVMREILGEEGFKIIEADNGATGLKLITEEKISLVILDLMMPRMDGYMFLEHLKSRWEKENHGFELPQILVLTALQYKDDLGLAQTLGAGDFMNKPFHRDELVKRVRWLLNKKSDDFL